MSDLVIEERTFRYVVVEGAPYDVGRQLAQAIVDDPGLVTRFTSGDPSAAGQGFGGFPGVVALADCYCPGLSDELQGFADTLQVDPARLLFYQVITAAPAGDPGPKCSHIAILPSITQDGHTLVARTDEGSLEMQDLCLITARRAGAFTHLGYSILLSGRSDGMNEHGLCVTTSGGGAYDVPTTTAGVMDAFTVRALLDRCRTVHEALALLQEIVPVNSSNLILTDATGRAALVEANAGRWAVRSISPAGGAGDDAEAYLCSGNHATLPEMVDYNTYVNSNLLENSKTRMEVIRSALQQARPQITKETLRAMLCMPIPAGLCAHYYRYGFGTVFQVIFDATARTAEVCFGPPTHNPWRTVSLGDPPGATRYATVYPHPR
jgi:predicted choloylglycine hydrolase